MKQKFSVEAFWKKVKHVAKQAGQSVIYASLLLFYERPDVPKRVKIIVIGALAYFIAPIDAIPDFIAGIGIRKNAYENKLNIPSGCFVLLFSYGLTNFDFY